ncbi:MAG: C69 family dipeptidase, partial [Phycisphaerales bacterium]
MLKSRTFGNFPRVASVLALSLLLSLPAVAPACFSVVVGKNASVDGQVIMAHNEDDGPPQIVNHYKVPRRRHAPGTKVTLVNGGQLDQVEQTWAYIWSELPGMRFSDSYVNEWGVGITSDNCPSREGKPEITDGGIGFKLRRLVAQRARTAREGVLLAGGLVERFGYVDSGRTYVICDPEEGWLFCVVNGKHWLAQRVSDDEVAMVANTYTIREVDLSDKDNVLACDDIVTYAVERGWYDPDKDGRFDFAAVYANPQSAVHPSNIGRQRDGLLYVASGPVPLGPELPFSVRPKAKVDIADIMKVLRHQPDVKKSLPAPTCPICSGGTQTSFVLQHRPGLPRDIATVYWVCLASPDTSFYLPFHFGIGAFPAGFSGSRERPSEAAFDARLAAPFQADPLQAFWTFANFRAKAHEGPARVISETKRRADELVARARRLQEPLEEAAVRLYAQNDRATARDLLANFSTGLYLSALESMNSIMADRKLHTKARELVHECLLIDTHQDTPYRLM